MVYLDEGVVALLDNNIKDHFDVDIRHRLYVCSENFLLTHPI